MRTNKPKVKKQIFMVRWECEIDAILKEDAVRQAIEMLKDPTNNAPFFHVMPPEANQFKEVDTSDWED